MNHKATQKFLNFTPNTALEHTFLLFFTLVNCLILGCEDSQKIQLTNKPDVFDWNDWHPAWSPNGDKIVFNSQRDGNYEIYAMNADGSNVRRITHHNERDDYPTWHPNGKKLGYVSERDGKYDLYLVEIPEN